MPLVAGLCDWFGSVCRACLHGWFCSDGRCTVLSGGHRACDLVGSSTDLMLAVYRLCHRLYTDNTSVNKPWRYKQSVVGDTREVSRFKIPERSTSTSGLINKTRINPYFVSTSRGTTLNLLPFAVSILLGNPSIVVVIMAQMAG